MVGSACIGVRGCLLLAEAGDEVSSWNYALPSMCSDWVQVWTVKYSELLE